MTKIITDQSQFCP